MPIMRFISFHFNECCVYIFTFIIFHMFFFLYLLYLTLTNYLSQQKYHSFLTKFKNSKILGCINQINIVLQINCSSLRIISTRQKFGGYKSMNNEIILGQSIDYAVESDRHQHCSLSAQGVIALLKISPLSIFETTPPLTESGIFFIFPQFVILIAHLTPG